LKKYIPLIMAHCILILTIAIDIIAVVYFKCKVPKPSIALLSWYTIIALIAYVLIIRYYIINRKTIKMASNVFKLKKAIDIIAKEHPFKNILFIEMEDGSGNNYNYLLQGEEEARFLKVPKVETETSNWPESKL
jgi:hypothetical protein